jgi:hypothetical protein
MNRVAREKVDEMFCSSFVESNDGLPAAADHRRMFDTNIHMARQVFWGNTGDNDLDNIDFSKIPARVDECNSMSPEYIEYEKYKSIIAELSNKIEAHEVTLQEKQKTFCLFKPTCWKIQEPIPNQATS